MKEEIDKLKPNLNDCGGCKYFVQAGSRIADRFPVKVDACVEQNYGRTCICLVKALSDPDTDLIEGNAYTR